MHPVNLAGPRVMLREFTSDDIGAIHAVYGDPKVTEHLSFDPRTRDQTRTTIFNAITLANVSPRVEYSLAAVTKDDVIGFARLAVDATHPGQSSAQLGFALRADTWGRGLGGEVVRLLQRLGFDELGLYRLWGARAPLNTISSRVMERAGMQVEGRIRGHIKVSGGWRDSVVHSILRDEWAPER